MEVLAFFPGGVAPTEMLVIGVVAVLLFGKKLPEVGRTVGRQLADFNRSFRSIQDEFRAAANSQPSSSSPAARRKPAVASDDFDERVEATAPKFRPPPASDG